MASTFTTIHADRSHMTHRCYICGSRTLLRKSVTADRWRCRAKKRCRRRLIRAERNDVYRSWAA